MKKLLAVITAVLCLDLAFIAYSYSTGIELAVNNASMPEMQSDVYEPRPDLPEFGDGTWPQDETSPAVVARSYRVEGISPSRRAPSRMRSEEAGTAKLLFPTKTITIGDEANATRRDVVRAVREPAATAVASRPQAEEKKRSFLAKTGSVMKKPIDWLKAVARAFD